MTGMVPAVRSVKALREQVFAWKAQGLRVGLVPTMGALHHGHLSLVDAIARKVDRIVVSIFVNPTQFGEGEDFDSYPRTEEGDRKKLTTTPASLVFIPNAAEMYPTGFATKVSVGGISDKFEGALRPEHFDGVATVVSKLMLQCLPDVAIFGEKDFQQLAVIRRFTADLNIPVEIMGGTLIREEDGLAASSRNAYLTEAERRISGQFNIILKDLVTAVQSGTPLRKAEEDASKRLVTAGFKSVDYVSVVDPESLEILKTLDRPARVIAVARIGSVRLLDNMAITMV